MDFRPLVPEAREKLAAALRANAMDGAALLMSGKDTSFVGSSEQTDEEVINAIRSVPCHYAGRLDMSAAEMIVEMAKEDWLGFFRQTLEDLGGILFTRETLRGKRAVLIRQTWHRIVKLNPKTVAVPNICYQTAESQERWAMKYPYAEVKDAR